MILYVKLHIAQVLWLYYVKRDLLCLRIDSLLLKVPHNNPDLIFFLKNIRAFVIVNITPQMFFIEFNFYTDIKPCLHLDQKTVHF